MTRHHCVECSSPSKEPLPSCIPIMQPKNECDQRHGLQQHGMWSSSNRNLDLGAIRRMQCPNKKNVIDNLDINTKWYRLHVRSTIHLHINLPTNLTETNNPRPVGIKWLIYLVNPLYVYEMWLGVDQRANIMKIHVRKRVSTSSYIKTPLHAIVGKASVYN